MSTENSSPLGSPDISEIRRRVPVRSGAASPRSGIAADVAAYRWSEPDLTQFAEGHKRRCQPFFELDRIGMVVAFGADEHDLDEMVVCLPARCFEVTVR